MTTTTRACDAPGCALTATLTPKPPKVVLDCCDAVWSDGTVEVIGGLPPDGTIRCRPHRPGSRYSRTCKHHYRHSTTEEAFTCEGHGEGMPGIEAYGVHVKGR